MAQCDDPPPPLQTFAGSVSMRENYDQQGVDGYYSQHGAAYRNPHVPGIMDACDGALDVWARCCLVPGHPEISADQWESLLHPRVLHCGSGTQRRRRPQHSGPRPPPPPQDHQQQPPQDGCQPYGLSLRGSEEQAAALLPVSCQGIPLPHTAQSVGYVAGPHIRVLDLACGSGEASQAVALWWQGTSLSSPATREQSTPSLELLLDATDPFTGAAFSAWNQGAVAERFSFQASAQRFDLD